LAEIWRVCFIESRAARSAAQSSDDDNNSTNEPVSLPLSNTTRGNTRAAVIMRSRSLPLRQPRRTHSIFPAIDDLAVRERYSSAVQFVSHFSVIVKSVVQVVGEQFIVWYMSIDF